MFGRITRLSVAIANANKVQWCSHLGIQRMRGGIKITKVIRTTKLTTFVLGYQNVVGLDDRII